MCTYLPYGSGSWYFLPTQLYIVFYCTAQSDSGVCVPGYLAGGIWPHAFEYLPLSTLQPIFFRLVGGAPGLPLDYVRDYYYYVLPSKSSSLETHGSRHKDAQKQSDANERKSLNLNSSPR
jgi:hypothetical protein